MKNILGQVRSEIQGSLNEFEAKRTEEISKIKKGKRISIYLLIVMGGILATSIFYFPYQSAGGPFPQPDFVDWLMIRVGIFIVLLLVYGSVLSWNKGAKETLDSDFKHKVFKTLVKYINAEAVYHPDQFIPKVSLENSGLIREEIKEVKGEDYFEGTMNNKNYLLSEVEVLYSSESGSLTHTAFKGVFLDVDILNKQKGGIMILPRKFTGESSKMVEVFLGGSKKTRLELASESQFGNYYEIIATNLSDVQQFLQPDLVKFLCRLKEEKGYDVKMNAGTGKAYIAISHTKSHDFFSVDYTKPVDKTLVHHSHKKSKGDILDEGLSWTDTQLQDLIDEVSLYFELIDVLTK